MSYLEDTFAVLWDAEEEFSNATFGPPSYRGPVGPLKHLEREAREAQTTPTDVEEYADCLLLIIDAARRAGFSRMQLLQGALLKVYKNAVREWPDWRAHPSDAVLEHVAPIAPTICGGEAKVVEEGQRVCPICLLTNPQPNHDCRKTVRLS